MSGDEGNPGVELGTVALDHRAYGDANQHPRIEREQDGTQQAEHGPVRSTSRLIHRAVTLTLLVGLVAVLIAWATVLMYAALWVAQRLPF